MSSNTRKNTKAITGSILGVAAVGILAVVLTVPSGAYWNDTDTARVDITTGTLSLGVSDVDNSGTIDLDFNNMAPGQLISQSFNIRNDGTVPATAYLGSNFSNSTPANPALNYGSLRVGVRPSNVPAVALVASNNLPAGWDLGVLQPGETKTFVFDVKLGGEAGNEWQGQSFGGNLPITLTQQ